MAELSWDDYLRAFHRDKPRATDEGLGIFRSAEGKTSYRLLADTLAGSVASTPAVLDLACGDGRLLAEIRAVAPAAAVTGLDMSPEEIARAQAQHPEATFVHAQAQALPFAAATFDAVLSHFAFMLMVPVAPVVAEIERVLRPSGFFACAWSSLAGAVGDLGDILRLKRAVESGRPRELPEFDPRQSTPEGVAELFAEAGSARRLTLRCVPVACDVDADGAWQFLDRLYFTEQLDPARRVELHASLAALAVARGGTFRLEQTIQIATIA
jgi:SAM-dependent methyltransferase